MPTYTYGSSTLNCNPDFPPLPLRLASRSDRVTIRLSWAPQSASDQALAGSTTAGSDRAVLYSSGKWLIRFPEQCDFLIEENGASVTLSPSPGVENSDLTHLLLDHVIPRLLDLRGYLVLHAGAVLANGHVIAFVGESGAGKSTLSTYFHLRGGRLLSDDGLIIEAENNTSLALPTYETLRLWPDSYRKLFDASSAYSVRDAGGGKINPVFNDAATSVCCPRPLAAIFLLSREGGAALSIRPVDPADACMAIVANSFQLDSSDLERASQRLKQAADISRHTPVFKLDYPMDYALLDEVHDAVMETIQS